MVEATAGLLAHSTALLADSLDMLGDSFVYGFSLYVLWRSAHWKTTAAVVNGVIMAAFAVGVLAHGIYKMMLSIVPTADTMGIIGTLVLLGNRICFLTALPPSFRRSQYALHLVMFAKRHSRKSRGFISRGWCKLFDSSWPDILVGGGIATLFLRSAFTVLGESFAELQKLRTE